MIGGCNDEDSIISLQPINLVEKVASDFFGDDRVKIFEDQVARGILPRLVEDELDAELRARPRIQSTNIQTGD